MSKGIVVGLLMVVALVVSAIGLMVTKNRRGAPSSTTTAKEKGISVSPLSFNGDDFTNFLELTKETGEMVSWQGQVGDLKIGSGAGVVMELAKQYGYTPVIVAHNAKPENTGLAVPLTESNKANQLNLISDFIEQYKPAYFGFGTEVNVMARKNTRDFEALVAFFNEVVDTVKAASSATQVFTIFQLEQMKGLNGGLFGGRNDPTQAQWDLLARFDRTDLFAFTTYPGLIYKSPGEIPADYYAEIERQTSKPVSFTEIGWHSAASPKGWEGSEAEQAEFVRRFFELSKDLDYHFAVWSFMFDQDTIEPFKSMGLRRADGSARPAWDEWVK